MGNYSLGIDLGSVTVKTVIIDADNRILFERYQKHCGDPLQTLVASLADISQELAIPLKVKVGVTGSGRGLVEDIISLKSVNEIVAQSYGVAQFYPHIRTIIEIGGQDAKYIELGKAESGTVRIINQRMNDICAAGTGAVIEQQAERLDILLEDFGTIALQSDQPAFIAGRCAVFSKTDTVHLKQLGISIPDIAAGVCEAVVRNYLSQFSKGNKLSTPVIFLGGLTANSGVVKAFQKQIGISVNDFLVPEHPKVMGAVGAALLVREDTTVSAISLDSLIEQISAPVSAHNNASQVHSTDPLTINITSLKPMVSGVPQANSKVYLGIDVGSTSTCIALIDGDERLLHKQYVQNKGVIIDSVTSALKGMRESIPDTCIIAGVGVTGSGRQLVSKFVGADITKDEISAQVRAAHHIWPQVDTVIEIGGQDSKFIQIAKGRVIDFEMNKVCAAGTGYFLQEQAERLGEPLDKLSDLAFKSQKPCALGSRCTVFMESDLVNYQQMGVGREDLAAGISFAIVQNYLEKVVDGRRIGENILFLGGVALNRSVVEAFQKVLQKPVVVPDHHEVSAAVGMALLAREEMLSENKPSQFQGFSAGRADYQISFFECGQCVNACRIGKMVFPQDGTYFLFGGVCGKYERDKIAASSLDLFKDREELLLSYWKPHPKGELGPIGIPRVHLFYELFPLYCTFLQELGYQVVLSDRTNSEISLQGLEKTVIDNCYASKLVYGHVQDLAAKGVQTIFFPSIIEFERRVKDLERNHSCPHIQGMPSLIKQAFPEINIISPYFYRDRSDYDWQRELLSLGYQLGLSAAITKRAVKKAAQAQEDFRHKCEQLGEQAVNNANPNERVLVLMGKVYNINDSKLNLNLAMKLRESGFKAIPYDCLPLSKQWLPQNYCDMVWSSGQDLLRTAKYIMEHSNLYPVFVTNFGCGPDSFIIKFLKEIFSNRSFLILEVDEHTSDIGFDTRIEAFVNSIQPGETTGFGEITSGFQPFLSSSSNLRKSDKLVYVPWGFDSYRAIAAACLSAGFKTKMLPPHDEYTEALGRKYTSGRECLPYIMHVGDAIRMTQDEEFNPQTAALVVPASDLACRVSLFSTSIQLILRDLGFPEVQLVAPRLSMDKDEVINSFGIKFSRNLFRGMLAIELISRKVPEIRPYEVYSGEVEKVYEQALDRICNAIARGNFFEELAAVCESFEQIELKPEPKRPVIGLVGDDYTRGNCFANNDLVKQIESLGGEVRTLPIWSTYFEYQTGYKPRKTLRRRDYIEYISDLVKAVICNADTRRINSIFMGKLQGVPDLRLSEMIKITSDYVDDRTEPLVIMALSHVINLLRDDIHGIVNIIGFQCMIHSIVAGHLRMMFAGSDIPNLTIYYDFQKRLHQTNRLEAFMHQVNQYKQDVDHYPQLIMAKR